MTRTIKEKSALIYLLKALIPYSKQNMQLGFKPNAFFNDLEKISKYKRRSLENAFYRAERQKLITRREHIVQLTEAGSHAVQPFVAKRLNKGAELMVIFDIPEDMAAIRARFRRTLRVWKFRQVQKSVWVSGYDHKAPLKDILKEMDIADYVILYECSRI